MGPSERVHIQGTLTVGNFPVERTSILRMEEGRHDDDCHRNCLLHNHSWFKPLHGSTVNFMCMPSWSSLQMTVHTTSYSPGSEGAVSRNSCLPGLNSRSHPSTLVRSLARSRVNPWIEPSRFQDLPRLAVTRSSTCSPALTVISGIRMPAIL